MNDDPSESGERGVITPSKQKIYRKIAVHGEKIINTLIMLLDSKNESVKLGAAKVLVNKIIPDLRATEHSGEIGLYKIYINEALKINGHQNTRTLHSSPEPRPDTPLGSQE